MSQFRNLVFEGGGVRGIAYAGAIKAMDEKNMLASVDRVGGTSAGAITAALMALGAGSEDIREIVGGTDFRKFMDDSWGIIRDVNRLLTDFGWFKGEAFSKWIKKQIFGLSGKRNLTFADLEKLKKDHPDRFRSLYVVGTNLSLQAPEVFSSESVPDMEIWYAVRISMSIPLFFAAVKEKDGDIFVDGGVTLNFPLDLFDDKKYLSDRENQRLFRVADYPTVKSDDHVYNKETLGFRVDTRDEIDAAKKNWRLPPKDIEDFVDYLKAVLGFMMDMANKAHLHENDWHRTVFIDGKGVGTTDFNLSTDKVKALIESGEKGANDYISWFEAPESNPKNRV
jgi:NTE family protein